MTLILNIDTATERASVGLTRDGKDLITAVNPNQKDHAAWLHPTIQRLLFDAKVSTGDIQAVAVTGGPGSYTGLRVGMATAKGLCFTLGIPLITESTLKVMALAAVLEFGPEQETAGMLFCPMIDARRMEVFAALYSHQLKQVQAPAAMVLGATSFEEELKSKRIIFFGDGSAKWKKICYNEHARFVDVNHSCKHLGTLAYEKFLRGEFADLAYSEPAYAKEFYGNRRT